MLQCIFQSSQYSQRESQELFQCLYFRGRGTDDENCIVDAVVYQLRTNGIFVFIPRYYQFNISWLIRENDNCSNDIKYEILFTEK